jgi:putative membrane protein
MKHILLATSALLVLACADQDAETMPGSEIGAVTDNSMTRPSAATMDANSFAQQMAMSDMFEIQSSRLAQERAASPQVREFARQIVADHTRTTAGLMAALANQPNRPTMPTALDAEHQRKVDQLSQAQGARFDEIYLDQQIEAHERALATLRAYAQNGDVDELRSFAAQTATEVERHLTYVRTLDDSGADESDAKGTTGSTSNKNTSPGSASQNQSGASNSAGPNSTNKTSTNTTTTPK